MALLDPVKPKVLSTKFIPNVAPDLQRDLGMTEDQRSIAMFTCDIDDCAYTAIDEATKKAEVKVVYAKSFYAGAAHSSGPLSGEFIGILAGPNPAETKAGLNAAIQYLAEEAWFYSANDTDDIVYFAHTISRTGSYLSECAGIPEGQPLAYLIAPPIEAVFGVDAAIKAADVSMPLWYGPPTETNFGGALLTGSQSACKAATEAFRDAVIAVARNPHDFDV
ncbi:MAG TPA: ethanolamine utilization microcompartment protein EutL [Firmicutes bacterium]|nr:ethanolamine utilization microcompartment protein EutL [Bacillota bacterium]